MAQFPGRLLTSFVLAVAVTAAASLAGLYLYFHAETEGHRLALVDRGEAVLDSLASGIESRGGYMRQCCLNRLGATLEELSDTPLILGVLVYNEPSNKSVKGGSLPPLASVAVDMPFWEPGKLTLAKRYVFQPLERSSAPVPCEEEARAGEAVPTLWTSGPYIFAVALNATDVDAMLQRDRVLFIVASIVILATIALAVLAVRNYHYHNTLKTGLLLAGERSTHLERLSQLGAGLAHETKNPLGVVRGLAQAIEEALDAPPDVRELASRIVDETDQTVGQINAFLALARPPKPSPVDVPLHTFCNDLVVLVGASAHHAGVTVVNHAAESVVQADEALLRRAMLNLLNNALRASSEGGTISIEASVVNGTATLSVVDTGCGISTEDLSHVVEPYFGRFEGGSGLGLGIVDQITRAHGWGLRIESVSGSGTKVSLEGIRVRSPNAC